MSRYIPLSIPNFEGNEKKYVLDAVEQGWVSTGGAYITKLERMLADYLHTEEAAACQSGTSGIHLALIECGVLPGDMVLVPTLTFIAAVNPVRYQFAEPVFLDCDKSLCVDPVKLRQFCEQECTLKENRLVHNLTQKTVKALIVVHVFGNFADMEAIMEIAETYHIKVIEDATESLGSRYEKGRFAGKYAGAIGDFGVFSFNGNKIITTGGGGAVTAKNAETVRHELVALEIFKTLEQKDYFLSSYEYGVKIAPLVKNRNYGFTSEQMEKLEEFIERKHKNYELYRELFSDFAYGKLLGFREDTYSNQWFYALELNGKLKFPLRNLIERLETFGVQTRAVWGLIHRQKPYQNCLAYEMERAPYYSGCILNLPCSTQITEEEIRYAAQTIQREIESWRITDD